MGFDRAPVNWCSAVNVVRGLSVIVGASPGPLGPGAATMAGRNTACHEGGPGGGRAPPGTTPQSEQPVMFSPVSTCSSKPVPVAVTGRPRHLLKASAHVPQHPPEHDIELFISVSFPYWFPRLLPIQRGRHPSAARDRQRTSARLRPPLMLIYKEQWGQQRDGLRVDWRGGMPIVLGRLVCNMREIRGRPLCC